MRHFLTCFLATGTLFGAALVFPTNKQAAAADSSQTYRQADHALAEALVNGDKKATASILDENFQWVEANGRIHTKEQVLEDLGPLATDNAGPIDVRTLDLLGVAERVLGIHHNERFAHIWVKRPAGWQALVFLDIPIPLERAESTEIPRPPRNPDADCENPCRTLLYKPENAAQQGAMDAWFYLKNDEWHPNPEDWAAHADDNHETISPNGDEPNLQHVAQLVQQRKLYGEKGADPGQPVMSMRMFDVGSVVVQECFQGPKGATKPTNWVVRMFVNRGDGWKIALSAQTTIQN